MKFENLKEDVEKLMNDCISSLSQATLDKDFDLKEDVEKLMNDCISSLSQATLDKDFGAVRAIGECIGRVNTLLKKICEVDSIEKAFETGVETQNLVDFIISNAPVFNRYRIEFRGFVKERMSEVSTREKTAPGPRIERKKRNPEDVLKVYEEVVSELDNEFGAGQYKKSFAYEKTAERLGIRTSSAIAIVSKARSEVNQ